MNFDTNNSNQNLKKDIVIGNAVVSYLFFSLFFLLYNGKDQNINNKFVKEHSKSALVIHFFMILTWFIFGFYGVGIGLSKKFSQYTNGILMKNMLISDLIAFVILVLLSLLLFYGALKASKGEGFSISDIGKITKSDKIVNIKENKKDEILDEKLKISYILSLVPFLGFVIKGKFFDNKNVNIENNLKLNLIFTFIIVLFYINNYSILCVLFLLGYIFFIGFYSLVLTTKNSIIELRFEKLPTIEELYTGLKISFVYLKRYFGEKTFMGYKELILARNKVVNLEKKLERKKLIKLKKPKIGGIIPYIPYLNIICLVDLRTQNKNHVINGLILTLLSIIIVVFTFLLKINILNYHIFIFIIMLFGFGYIKVIEWKIPFLYDIFTLFGIFSKTKKKMIKAKKENEGEEVFEIKNNK